MLGKKKNAWEQLLTLASLFAGYKHYTGFSHGNGVLLI